MTCQSYQLHPSQPLRRQSRPSRPSLCSGGGDKGPRGNTANARSITAILRTTLIPVMLTGSIICSMAGCERTIDPTRTSRPGITYIRDAYIVHADDCDDIPVAALETRTRVRHQFLMPSSTFEWLVKKATREESPQ